MTFSVVARDPATGDLGGAVQSKFLAVGAGVLHAQAGVGAVATQALANLSYGPRGLALLAAGAAPAQAIEVLNTSDPLAHRRQVGIVDATGRAASATGSGCMAWAGHLFEDGFACQGNILVSAGVIDAMAEAMSRANRPFPERLLGALEAGQAAGGDSRGQQSAAVLVVRSGGGYGGGSDRVVDLRVDDHSAPITELARLLSLHHLHFDRPAESDLLAIDAALRLEIAARLSRVTGVAPESEEDLDALWDRLDRWAGRENLEERMVRRGSVDRQVLRILREEDAASGSER